jgi:hypothetical protein
VGTESVLDVLSALAKGSRDVDDDILAILLSENFVEESARLLIVVIGMLVRVSSDWATDYLLGPGVRLILCGTSKGIRFIVGGELTTVAIAGQGAITEIVIAHSSSVGAVDWDLLVVFAESVAVGVRVVQESSLKHLVHRGFDTGHQVGGRVSNLLSLSMVVGRVPVESNSTDGDQGVVFVGPGLGDIEDIESVRGSVLLRHGLNEPVPGRVVTFLNFVVEVVGAPFWVLCSLSLSLSSCEALNTLSGLVVVLNVVNFFFVVDPSESVGWVTIDVAVAVWCSSVGEQDGHLMESLRRVAPEVEGRVGVLGVVNGVTLLWVNEVGELNWILDEENGGVVTDHVVVTFFSVMLDWESTGVTVTIISTSLTSDGRESEEDGSALANLVHKFGLAKTI